MSDSVRHHRLQPTRLPRPWDSPGKKTGVSCHLLLQCMKMKSESEVTQSCLTPSDPMDCSPPGPSIHTGVGCHCLLRSWVFLFFFNLILFFKLYIIVLVLPNIKYPGFDHTYVTTHSKTLSFAFLHVISLMVFCSLFLYC